MLRRRFATELSTARGSRLKRRQNVFRLGRTDDVSGVLCGETQDLAEFHAVVLPVGRVKRLGLFKYARAGIDNKRAPFALT